MEAKLRNAEEKRKELLDLRIRKAHEEDEKVGPLMVVGIVEWMVFVNDRIYNCQGSRDGVAGGRDEKVGPGMELLEAEMRRWDSF